MSNGDYRFHKRSENHLPWQHPCRVRRIKTSRSKSTVLKRKTKLGKGQSQLIFNYLQHFKVCNVPDSIVEVFLAAEELSDMLVSVSVAS